LFALGARGRDPGTGLTESHDLLVDACPSCTRRPIDACFWRTTRVTDTSLAADGILAMDRAHRVGLDRHRYWSATSVSWSGLLTRI